MARSRALLRRLDELPASWARDIAEAVAEVEQRFRDNLEASRNEYIGPRLLGLPFVVVGAAMLAVSSFVG